MGNNCSTTDVVLPVLLMVLFTANNTFRHTNAQYQTVEHIPTFVQHVECHNQRHDCWDFRGHLTEFATR